MKLCGACGGAMEQGSTYHRCYQCRRARWIALDAFGSKAHRAVAAAIRAGMLPSLRDGKTPCADCRDVARVYDHRDYSLPLAVDPVCRRCNILRGPAKQTAEYLAQNPRPRKAVA